MKKISVSQVFNSTGRLLSRRPAVLLPLAVVSAFEMAALIVLYLIPQSPVGIVLGPPVRRFFGEAYLHYPMDLVLLPRLFQYAQLVIGFVIGSLMTGAMVAMIRSAVDQGPAGPGWTAAVRSVLPRYLSLTAVTVLSYALAKAGMSAVRAALGWGFIQAPVVMSRLPRYGLSAAWAGTDFLLGLAAETLFVYAVPAIVIENEGALRAILRSARLVARNFLPTFVLVAFPVAVYYVCMVFRGLIPTWMERTSYPEISLWILAASSAVSFAVNSLVAASATVLYLTARQNEPAS